MRLILDLFNPWFEMLVADKLEREFGDEPEFTTPDGRLWVLVLLWETVSPVILYPIQFCKIR